MKYAITSRPTLYLLTPRHFFPQLTGRLQFNCQSNGRYIFLNNCFKISKTSNEKRLKEFVLKDSVNNNDVLRKKIFNISGFYILLRKDIIKYLSTVEKTFINKIVMPF